MISALPPELAERTLALCHPKDVAAFAQTCRRAHALVFESPDQHLWRTLFLDFPFDDPRLAVPPTASDSTNVDWRAKLQRRLRAERTALRDGDRREFVDVLLECMDEAAPRGPTLEPSGNVSWVTKILTLKESPWIEKGLRLEQPESPSLWPFALEVEKLRSLLSLSLDPAVGADASQELKALRRMSRAYIYDLRKYNKETLYGPFTDAGDHVNWTHVSTMINVMTLNLRDFGVHWPKEFKPQAIVQGLEACRPFSASGISKRSPLDWAGVEGQWLRIVSFCDYRDLIRFNVSGRFYRSVVELIESICDQNSGCNPDFFDDEYQEASRLLRLNLRVVSVESDPKVLEKLPDPSRPPITFGGTMRGFNSDDVLNRGIRGTVQVMKDGHIQWSYVAVYNRLDQWSSEGVQIGGQCSAAGIVGAWSGAQHAEGDPQGPFWLFRGEETPENTRNASRRK